MIVFDIDGVLADPGHRLHHLAGGRRDWEAFFAAADADPVIEAGRTRLLAALPAVTLVTGRPERLRTMTVAWLDRHGIPDLPLVMRPDDDRTPAAILKVALVRSLGGPDSIVEVVDDEPGVVAALTAAGYRAVLFP